MAEVKANREDIDQFAEFVRVESGRWADIIRALERRWSRGDIIPAEAGSCKWRTS